MNKKLFILGGIVVGMGMVLSVKSYGNAPDYLVKCANAIADGNACEPFSVRLEWDITRGAYTPQGACASYVDFIKNCVMAIQTGRANAESCKGILMGMEKSAPQYSMAWQALQPGGSCNTGPIAFKVDSSK